MEIQTIPGNALDVQRMEFDVQISTAKKFPRVVETCKANALAMIKSDRDFASSCNYSRTVGGELLTGPSIRIAEVILSTWGNMRAAARLIGQDDQFVYLQAFAHDLESNSRVDVEVPRRITKSDGKTKYTPDMIQTTIAAGVSFGIRNSVFKVVPFAYVKALAEEAKLFAVGPTDQIAKRVENVLRHFELIGVDRSKVFSKFKVDSAEAVDGSTLGVMMGIITSLRDKQTTVEAEFGAAFKAPQRKSETAAELAAEVQESLPQDEDPYAGI